jgi:peptide deformylase
MPELPIVRLGHPALRTPAEPVPAGKLGGAELRALVADLIDTMRAAEGVGLAAPQVGVGWQLFVYEALADDDPAAGIPLRVVVNPMVEPHPGELLYDWEGCLSIPDLRELVPRHPEVRVRGFDVDGTPLDYVAGGFEARIVQHEFDHLNGVVFLDRMRDLQSLAFFEEWQSFLSEGEAAEHDPRPE